MDLPLKDYIRAHLENVRIYAEIATDTRFEAVTKKKVAQANATLARNNTGLLATLIRQHNFMNQRAAASKILKEKAKVEKIKNWHQSIIDRSNTQADIARKRIAVELQKRQQATDRIWI